MNKKIRHWWLLTIVGTLLIILGLYVFNNPVKNYIALSILFSIIMFISGTVEIIFALSNLKMIKSWGWLLSSGIFDLIIGIILITKENITIEILPFIFGIWLIFRGVSQISKGILLKEVSSRNWAWSVFGGILVSIFGFFVIYSPSLGASAIVIWTALSLIILGVFTILFSFIIKKIEKI